MVHIVADNNFQEIVIIPKSTHICVIIIRDARGECDINIIEASLSLEPRRGYFRSRHVTLVEEVDVTVLIVDGQMIFRRVLFSINQLSIVVALKHIHVVPAQSERPFILISIVIDFFRIVR